MPILTVFLNQQITEAGWAFSIWGVIYTWQFLWVIYAWTFVCRPNTPRTIFTGVYFGYVLICILNIAWIFVWGNAEVSWAAAILIIINLVFYPTIASLAFFLSRADGAKVYDIWLTRVLVLNGLLVYATWTTIASLINLAASVEYDRGVSGSTASYISLSLLSATVITYFILENSVLDRFLRYAFAVYPVIIWTLSASLVKKWNRSDPSGVNIFSLVLLVVTVVLTLVRILLFVLFIFFRPLRPRNIIKVYHRTLLDAKSAC